MKHKITKKWYQEECNDDCCCYESGYEWTVDGEFVHKSPCEDNGLLAVLNHLGIEAEIVFLDEDGEETCSL